MAAVAQDGPMLSDSDIDEADIEALARSHLRPGEAILGEGKQTEEAESRGVCNAPLLLMKLKEIEYKVPEGAKRVPWIDTLCVDGQQDLPKGISAKDGVKLESAFLTIAGDAVKEGYRRLRVMKVPCSRPSDFYAEMLKTDKQMFLVRQRAAEEGRRIKIVEDRRKSQAAKKFAKRARTKKLEVRAEEKRQSLEDINAWRQSKKGENNEDDKDLEDILDRKSTKGKKGEMQKSRKRQAKDEKFGFGGKKRFKKSNDTKSVNDFSRSPWSKDKGKGKGKGGKGKGKGKGKSGGKGPSKGGAPSQGDGGGPSKKRRKK